MRSLSLLITLLFAFSLESKPWITREYIDQLRKEVDWEVVEYEDSIFKDWTEDDFMESFGQNKYDESLLPEEILPVADDSEDQVKTDPPREFDGRKKWGACVHPIRNQGKCGSCWGMALTEMMSDRFCLAKRDVILSPQYVVACVKGPGFSGCQGGHAPSAMEHAISKGIVTEKCLPYTLAGTTSTPPCPNKCKDGSDWKKRYYCKRGSKIIFRGNIKASKQEIFDHGPMATWFRHTKSFEAYKGGIYKCKEDYTRLGHYMKIVGWGVASNINYWIIANSYGTKWGENGYIRFQMNRCNIDEVVFACSPDLSRFDAF